MVWILYDVLEENIVGKGVLVVLSYVLRTQGWYWLHFMWSVPTKDWLPLYKTVLLHHVWITVVKIVEVNVQNVKEGRNVWWQNYEIQANIIL